MFLMRLMSSSRDFCGLYPRQDQVCFLDGHVRAFAHLGCVPSRAVYDNLKAAVKRHLVGSERELSGRFMAMTVHDALEASFCRPRTGHDKGGVESRGKNILKLIRFGGHSVYASLIRAARSYSAGLCWPRAECILCWL